MLINIIRGVFAISGLIVAGFMAKDINKYRKSGDLAKDTASPVKSGILGFVANFCDAIGIGSYAVAVTLNRFLNVIPVKLLPGTLTVGIGVLPTMIEIIIGMSIIPVDPILVITVAILASAGGYIGAKLISHFSEKKVLMILGPILVIVGVIVAIKAYTAIMGGSSNSGEVSDLPIGFTGWKLVVTGIGAFIIGMLQAWGLGFFAPIMALLAVLGLNPQSIFPVMYTGAGAGMIASSFKFIEEGQYAKKSSIYMAIFGIIGVVLALLFISGLPVDYLNILIAIILLYIGSEMFLRGRKIN